MNDWAVMALTSGATCCGVVAGFCIGAGEVWAAGAFFALAVGLIGTMLLGGRRAH